LDNDIDLLSTGWVTGIKRLAAYWRGLGRHLAMISAYYEPWQQQRVTGKEEFERKTVWHIQPVVGHAVYHTAEFMDRVGHFDVLREDHIYGFEDLLLSHKATHLGWECIAWEGWMIENLQRQSALTRNVRDDHVTEMRPLYKRRIMAMQLSGSVHTNSDGLPDHNGG